MKGAIRALVLCALALNLGGCTDSTLKTAVLQELGLKPTALASGSGQGVYVSTNGVTYSSSFWGSPTPPSMTYDTNGAMTAVSGWVANGTVPDFGADGIVAWGRWTAGSLIAAPGGNVAVMHYAVSGIASTPNIVGLVKTYSAYRSTPPTIESGGVVTQMGAADSVTGSISVNYGGGNAGTCNLSIVIGSHRFSVSTGAFALTPSPNFASGGTVTSSTDPITAPTGLVDAGMMIQGIVVGTSAERIVLNFGFNPGVGNITGAVVFR